LDGLEGRLKGSQGQTLNWLCVTQARGEEKNLEIREKQGPLGEGEQRLLNTGPSGGGILRDPREGDSVAIYRNTEWG